MSVAPILIETSDDIGIQRRSPLIRGSSNWRGLALASRCSAAVLCKRLWCPFWPFPVGQWGSLDGHFPILL